MGKTGRFGSLLVLCFLALGGHCLQMLRLPGFGTHANTRQNLPYRAFPASIQEQSLGIYHIVLSLLVSRNCPSKCLFFMANAKLPNRPGFVPPGGLCEGEELGAKKTIEEKKDKQKFHEIVLGFWGGFSLCAFLPIRNAPKKHSHPPSPGTIPEIRLRLCAFSFPEQISKLGVLCAPVAIINFALLCRNSLLNPTYTQRFLQEFDAKLIIATGAHATPMIEISPLTNPPLWKPLKTASKDTQQIKRSSRFFLLFSCSFSNIFLEDH